MSPSKIKFLKKKTEGFKVGGIDNIDEKRSAEFVKRRCAEYINDIGKKSESATKKKEGSFEDNYEKQQQEDEKKLAEEYR